MDFRGYHNPKKTGRRGRPFVRRREYMNLKYIDSHADRACGAREIGRESIYPQAMNPANSSVAYECEDRAQQEQCDRLFGNNPHYRRRQNRDDPLPNHEWGRHRDIDCVQYNESDGYYDDSRHHENDAECLDKVSYLQREYEQNRQRDRGGSQNDFQKRDRDNPQNHHDNDRGWRDSLRQYYGQGDRESFVDGYEDRERPPDEYDRESPQYGWLDRGGPHYERSTDEKSQWHEHGQEYENYVMEYNDSNEKWIADEGLRETTSWDTLYLDQQDEVHFWNHSRRREEELLTEDACMDPSWHPQERDLSLISVHNNQQHFNSRTKRPQGGRKWCYESKGRDSYGSMPNPGAQYYHGNKPQARGRKRGTSTLTGNHDGNERNSPQGKQRKNSPMHLEHPPSKDHHLGKEVGKSQTGRQSLSAEREGISLKSKVEEGNMEKERIVEEDTHNPALSQDIHSFKRSRSGSKERIGQDQNSAASQDSQNFKRSRSGSKERIGQDHSPKLRHNSEGNKRSGSKERIGHDHSSEPSQDSQNFKRSRSGSKERIGHDHSPKLSHNYKGNKRSDSKERIGQDHNSAPSQDSQNFKRSRSGSRERIGHDHSSEPSQDSQNFKRSRSDSNEIAGHDHCPKLSHDSEGNKRSDSKERIGHDHSPKLSHNSEGNKRSDSKERTGHDHSSEPSQDSQNFKRSRSGSKERIGQDHSPKLSHNYKGNKRSDSKERTGQDHNSAPSQDSQNFKRSRSDSKERIGHDHSSEPSQDSQNFKRSRSDSNEIAGHDHCPKLSHDSEGNKRSDSTERIGHDHSPKLSHNSEGNKRSDSKERTGHDHSSEPSQDSQNFKRSRSGSKERIGRDHSPKLNHHSEGNKRSDSKERISHNSEGNKRSDSKERISHNSEGNKRSGSKERIGHDHSAKLGQDSEGNKRSGSKERIGHDHSAKLGQDSEGNKKSDSKERIGHDHSAKLGQDSEGNKRSDSKERIGHDHSAKLGQDSEGNKRSDSKERISHNSEGNKRSDSKERISHNSEGNKRSDSKERIGHDQEDGSRYSSLSITDVKDIDPGMSVESTSVSPYNQTVSKDSTSNEIVQVTLGERDVEHKESLSSKVENDESVTVTEETRTVTGDSSTEVDQQIGSPTPSDMSICSAHSEDEDDSFQVTEQEFNMEMLRRLRLELASTRDPMDREERITQQIREMAKLSPTLFRQFMAKNADKLSEMILMQPPQQKQEGQHEKYREVESRTSHQPAASETEANRDTLSTSDGREKVQQGNLDTVCNDCPESIDMRPNEFIPLHQSNKNTGSVEKTANFFVLPEHVQPAQESQTEMDVSGFRKDAGGQEYIQPEQESKSLKVIHGAVTEPEWVKKLSALKYEYDSLSKEKDQYLQNKHSSKTYYNPDADPYIIETRKRLGKITVQMKLLRESEGRPVSVQSETPSSSNGPTDVECCSTTETASKLSVGVQNIKERDTSAVQCKYVDRGNHCCMQCNVFSNNLTEFFSHLTSCTHREKQHDYSQTWQKKAKEIHKENSPLGKVDHRPIKGAEMLIATVAFFCPVCHVMCEDMKVADAHLRTEKHNNKYKAYLSRHPTYERRYKLRCWASRKVTQTQDTEDIEESGERTSHGKKKSF